MWPIPLLKRLSKHKQSPTVVATTACDGAAFPGLSVPAQLLLSRSGEKRSPVVFW
jgi:hypothetical protein